ncbi:MAG TPA: hypothetical protein VEK08_22295 [Planctomycetota bacterium]|nr:hypothetical protein [Planctomycetota bacterium]
MRILALLIFASSALLLAGEPAPTPRPGIRPDLAGAELDPEWLAIIERIRTLPRPGEIRNIGLTTDVTAVYDLSAEQKAEIEKQVRAYEAELLKLAAKWHQEQIALRSTYEAKVIATLPDAKKENARKVLDFSHTNWITPLDRDEAFKKEFSKRVADLRENRAKLSVDELNAAREEMQAWVKTQRDARIEKDQNVIKQLEAMLTPEEAERLKQFVRFRSEPEPPQKETPPAEPKPEKTKKPKK